ncbi:MAG TPA: hypothetical protein PLZ36_03940 [Armatimonadota bacterium]|nr:hypothetical protein [Armatimonadota bacterium]
MSQTDRDILRSLAARWREWAEQPVMAERARAWTALHDLCGERVMVLFETGLLEHYVTEDELRCTDPANRGLEMHLRRTLRHVEEVGDDTVLEPYWTVGWQTRGEGYGIDYTMTRSTDAEGGGQGYTYDHPIRTPEDLERLRPRAWTVDREATERARERMDALFGDLLPVQVKGPGCFVPALTAEVFRLAGNDNLLMWPYDEPEAIHRLMRYLCDDRLAMYDWMEREGLLSLNTDSRYVGSGSPGFTSALPAPGSKEPARLNDLWVWMESQETTMVSPDMFAEFFLPYMAEICRRFGLVYYGCCEPIDDRWAQILAQVDNIRAVSVSPWNDFRKAGELLGPDYVYSRKPKPAPMSGATPDWDALREDIDDTLAGARGCNLEIVFRDVYRISDRERLATWVQMVRERSAAVA